MKAAFWFSLTGLLVASALTLWFTPEERSDVPVLYWVTDANPAREAQVEQFYRWLAKHHYPRLRIRIDTANNDPSKKIIQGVSGVGGDLMDLYGGAMLRFVQATGILADVTDDARAQGFDLTHTYASLEPQLAIEDRQYAFPANVYNNLLWVNRATLAKYNLPAPPTRWTLEEFELAGKAFVTAVNKPGQPRTAFFINTIYPAEIRRSLGLDVFNETLTRCTLDDPRWAQTMKLIRKWTYDDHLLPMPSELDSFVAEYGFAGADVTLFRNGNFALIEYGRQVLVQLRDSGNLDLATIEPPHGGFPNTYLDARATAIYAGSKHRDLARYFLAFLASDEYNAQIARDADALPPNPSVPPADPFHAAFATAARDIGIVDSHSPFVLPSEVANATWSPYQGYMAGVYTAEQAAQIAAERINAAIARSLQENPPLQARYDALTARQQEIDARRAAGQKVPFAWIENPFHRRYYVAMGWVE